MISRTRSTGGALPLTIRPFGNWVGTSAFIADLPALIAAGSMSGQKSAANKLRRLIRQNIKHQGPPGVTWAKLKPNYSKQKGAEGYNPDQLLIRTGLYYRSIKIWQKGNKWLVGVKRGVRASGGRKTVGWIAHLLERGSDAANITARPLWVPTFKQFGGNKRIKSIIVWHIANLIYLKHGVKVKIY